MDWPAYSPDLNPIEHVLDALGRRIAARLHHPENTQQLKQMLIEEWVLLPYADKREKDPFVSLFAGEKLRKWVVENSDSFQRAVRKMKKDAFAMCFSVSHAFKTTALLDKRAPTMRLDRQKIKGVGKSEEASQPAIPYLGSPRIYENENGLRTKKLRVQRQHSRDRASEHTQTRCGITE
ncbi:transposable element Tc1 transposase [Trichonephila clavipes]|nr:transposable element Tc1 transposase [Trichonephila clavipes]